MNPAAMKPFGVALSDYYWGKRDAVIEVCRDDGWETEMPVSTFFRQAQDYDLERIALDLCRDRVLDVGAGTGLHSLHLHDKGLQVYAIDVFARSSSNHARPWSP